MDFNVARSTKQMSNIILYVKTSAKKHKLNTNAESYFKNLNRDPCRNELDQSYSMETSYLKWTIIPALLFMHLRLV